MKHNKLLGNWGEDFASRYLVQSGYTVLERSFQTPYGEIDIIAQEGSQLVFVEVKTRASKTFGDPEDAITQQKREHMIAAAEHFLQTHTQFEDSWRIDVIAIEGSSRSTQPMINHFENAVC